MRFLIFLVVFSALSLACSEEKTTVPKDYPLGITGTWEGKLGDRALKIDLVQWASGPITGNVFLGGSDTPYRILEGAHVWSDSLAVGFSTCGLCGYSLDGRFARPDSIAGTSYFWEPNPIIGRPYPTLSWWAHRTSKQLRVD